MTLIDSIRGKAHEVPESTPAALEGPGSPFGPGVRNAFDKVAQIEVRRAEVEAEIAARQAELSDAERRAGDDVYENPAAAARIATELDGLRSQIGLQQRALAVAAGKVDKAKRAALAAQARDLNSRAGELAKAVDVRRAKTAQLLDELEAHEGRRYEVPALKRIDGTPSSATELTQTEKAMVEVRRLKRLAYLVQCVSDGQPLPGYWSMVEQVTEFPATVRGPAALFGDLAVVTYPLDAPSELTSIAI
jgi:hypothetical protein